MENIYLVGFMGTGKTTIANAMSNLLPLRVIEMDETIEMLAGKTIPEIFADEGEESFRKMETMFLQAISKEKNQIISCGGGVVLKEENIEIMKSNGLVIRLSATPETVYERVSKADNRPLLQDKKSIDDIKNMMSARQEYYDKAADMTFSVDSKTPDEIAGEIIKELALKGYLH